MNKVVINKKKGGLGDPSKGNWQKWIYPFYPENKEINELQILKLRGKPNKQNKKKVGMVLKKIV